MTEVETPNTTFLGGYLLSTRTGMVAVRIREDKALFTAR